MDKSGFTFSYNSHPGRVKIEVVKYIPLQIEATLMALVINQTI